MNDEIFMLEALKEADKAAKMGEVPVGAVAVLENSIINRAHNIREAEKNPLGHAEILLIEKIVKSNVLPSWRFDEVTIYVTCEPCIMCMGALIQARVKRLVYGCSDPKMGAAKNLDHGIEVTNGVLENECAKALGNFFKTLRSQ